MTDIVIGIDVQAARRCPFAVLDTRARAGERSTFRQIQLRLIRALSTAWCSPIRARSGMPCSQGRTPYTPLGNVNFPLRGPAAGLPSGAIRHMITRCPFPLPPVARKRDERGRPMVGSGHWTTAPVVSRLPGHVGLQQAQGAFGNYSRLANASGFPSISGATPTLADGPYRSGP